MPPEKRFRVTPEFIQAVLAAHAQGGSPTTIGVAHGVSTSLISKILRQQGITSRISDEQKSRVFNALAAGKSGREAAAEGGITPSAVSILRKRAGFTSNGTGSKKVFSPEQEANVLARYAAGESAFTIAEALGVGDQTVYRTLRRHGQTSREFHTVITEEIETNIVDTALDGDITADEIATANSISKSAVMHILRERDLHLPRNPRQHSLNEEAFDTLTPEASYWVGFLCADGHIQNPKHVDGKRQRNISVNLSAVDRSHLEKFRAFLGSTHRISDVAPIESVLRNPTGAQRTIKSGPAVSFRVRSNRLVERLEEYGMGPVKADRVPLLGLEMSRDFWRGVLDGDGDIGTVDETYIYPLFSVNGQTALCESFQRFLVEKLALNLRHVPVSTIRRVTTSGERARDVLQLLYDGATVALDRKAARARALIDGTQKTLFTPYPKVAG